MKGPRFRVVSDNDYSGDPDGLYQLVHLLLSPSVEVRGLIGSHLAPGDEHDPSDHTADNALREIRTVLELLGRDVQAVAGFNRGLADTGPRSPGAELIVREAMRTDTDLPLFVTLGAGLTSLAGAYLLEPAIAARLTAVWIGGPEHPGLGAPAFIGPDPEYNLKIDIPAARVVFNDSDIDLWQVPRNAYRQCLASMTELAARVAPLGALGRHLFDALVAAQEREARNLGETYVLGDNPLVLLTALLSAFEPDTSSSRFELMPCPRIGEDGSYEPAPAGREIRVYTWLDVRLMLEDFFWKLSEHGSAA